MAKRTRRHPQVTMRHKEAQRAAMQRTEAQRSFEEMCARYGPPVMRTDTDDAFAPIPFTKEPLFTVGSPPGAMPYTREEAVEALCAMGCSRPLAENKIDELFGAPPVVPIVIAPKRLCDACVAFWARYTTVLPDGLVETKTIGRMCPCGGRVSDDIERVVEYQRRAKETP